MYTIEVERLALLTVQVDGDTLKEALEQLNQGKGEWDLADVDMADYEGTPTDIVSVRQAGIGEEVFGYTEQDDKRRDEARVLWKEIAG
jgi:hypothetical protein